MKTVIYHSADFDGIFCREIAKHFLGTDGVNYIGWDFRDPPIDLPINGEFIIMDLPIDKPFGLDIKDGFLMKGAELFTPLDQVDWGKFIWIDHHKSAIESHPKEIPGYRIDGVSACRLAWQWFTDDKAMSGGEFMHELPLKQDYLDRKVVEPVAVRLAGEYDIWDHRGDGDLEFQFGLRCQTEVNWSALLHDNQAYTRSICRVGEIAMAYSKGVDASVTKANSFLVEWEGLKFLALNTGRCNSNTFAAKDVPETGHDALLAFFTNGKTFLVSLYHAAHRKDLDLSLIAVKNGGGGHRGACGFTCKTLPFQV